MLMLLMCSNKRFCVFTETERHVVFVCEPRQPEFIVRIRSVFRTCVTKVFYCIEIMYIFENREREILYRQNANGIGKSAIASEPRRGESENDAHTHTQHYKPSHFSKMPFTSYSLRLIFTMHSPYYGQLSSNHFFCCVVDTFNRNGIYFYMLFLATFIELIISTYKKEEINTQVYTCLENCSWQKARNRNRFRGKKQKIEITSIKTLNEEDMSLCGNSVEYCAFLFQQNLLNDADDEKRMLHLMKS